MQDHSCKWTTRLYDDALYHEPTMQIPASSLILNFVLLHLNLEVLRDLRLLRTCALWVDHKPYRAVSSSFARVRSVVICRDWRQWMDTPLFRDGVLAA